MIVIHIIGRSNSGKTYLVQKLCSYLSTIGHVETIKHIGHHEITLEEGKDTTIHFRSGARGTTGIDAEKSVTIMEGGDLYAALDAASDRGAAFCIVEGYKQVPIPGVALGDLNDVEALLRDPTVEEIIASLDIFPRWTTPEAIITRLLSTGEGQDASHSIPPDCGGLIILDGAAQKDLDHAAEAARRCPGITGAEGSVLITGCERLPITQRGCLAITGRSAAAVALALSIGLKDLKP